MFASCLPVGLCLCMYMYGRLSVCLPVCLPCPSVCFSVFPACISDVCLLACLYYCVGGQNLQCPVLDISIDIVCLPMIKSSRVDSYVVYIGGSQPVGRDPLVGRGRLPGGPRPRLGIETFFDASNVSQSLKGTKS